MKKFMRIILAIMLIANFLVPVKVKAEESNIIQEATELLNSALSHNELFNLPNVENKNIYISNPISLYKKESNDEYSLFEDKEYYLIYTDDEFIAGLVAIYENDEIASIIFNVSLAELFNKYNIKNEEFIFAIQDDEYTLEVIDASQNTGLLQNEIYSISKLSNINLSSSYIQARSSGRVLDIDYVPQGIYNTCWAASALAVGWYYYPDKCSDYTAATMSDAMGISKYQGASMSETREILSTYFNITTTHISTTMDKGTIINHINNSRPIIIGYRITPAEDSSVSVAKGHMVVLAGFRVSASSSTVNYYFRDSKTSSFVIVSSTTFPNTYEFEGVTLKWKEACYKN